MTRPWTLEELREAVAMSSEAWLDGRDGKQGSHIKRRTFAEALPWEWVIFAQRLTYFYGEDGALQRLNALPEVRAA